MTLQTDLEAILKLARTEVKCPTCAGEPYFSSHWPCQNCHGTGKVPNPRYASLVEALTEPCRNQHFGPGWWPIKCADVGCSGRVLRPWTELPQGALAGVLSYHARGLTDQKGKPLALRLMMVFGTVDPNAAAAQWWLEYLEAMEKEAAHATE